MHAVGMQMHMFSSWDIFVLSLSFNHTINKRTLNSRQILMRILVIKILLAK